MSSGTWCYCICIVELMLMPTSSTYTANRAPADMRGRYMSVYGLTWAVAQGLGPLIGGILSDNISPVAPWFGGGVFGVVAVSAFVVLAMRTQHQKTELAQGD